MATLSLPEPVRRALDDRLAGPSVRLAVTAVGLYAGIEIAFGRHHLVPGGIILLGLIQGALYGLIAFGLILVYRANRLISFAQAGLGSLPALAALLLITNHGVPYLVALPLMLVGAAATGYLVERVVMRRFTSAPRLVATVATIGLAQVLALGELGVTNALTGRALAPTKFPTPFAGLSFTFAGVVFTGDYLIIIAVVATVLVGLNLFFRRTRMGIAVRASAENADRAALLGIPVARVSTVVWVIGAVCSGLGVFLRAPVVGLPPGGNVSYTLLLYALAAAVIARMDNLGVALVAGMALGAVNQAAVFGTSRGDLSVAVILPIVLVALLAQRAAISRALDTGVSSFKALREYRPIPTELISLPEVTALKYGGAALLAVLAVAMPALLGTANIGFATLVVIYALIGLSLVVLSGWAGQISLGQVGFAGIGAAVAGGLAVNHRADFFVAIISAGLVGAAVAALIGLPALRVQGLFLAVVTLAFAATVQFLVLDPKYFKFLLPGRSGQVLRPVLYGRFSLGGEKAFYYACLVVLALTLLSLRSLRRSRSGRSFIAVRDNVRAAQSYGMSSSGSRLTAFAFSGFIAAVAGGLLAYKTGSVEASGFPLALSVDVFIFAVIGGLASPAGALLGAVYFEGLKYFGAKIPIPFVGHVKILADLGTGVGVLLLLIALPGGLVEAVYGLRDRFLRRVADRHDLLVPSLVADRRVEVPHGPSAEEVDVLARAETAIEDVDTFTAVDHAGTIRCPACRERIPLAEAETHEHFVEAGL